MTEHAIPRAASAYDAPLLVRHLLTRLDTQHRDQEIVYAHHRRLTYQTFHERIARAANMLDSLGVGAGDTVAVFDWDSHRYLECLFAIPMLGAVLHTVNIRLSPEQILYTMNHAADKVVLIHQDFFPLLEAIADRTQTVTTWVLLTDDAVDVESPVTLAGEYETLVEAADDNRSFLDFDENTRATTFYTTGTTGDPKGVCFSHRQLVIHTLGQVAALASPASQGCFHNSDVYMPITPMFHVHAWGIPYMATLLGVKQVYPGRYDPATLITLIKNEGVTFSHCVPTILHMLLNAPEAQDADFSRWKVIVGGSAMSPALARQALDMGIDVFSGYGMSETCPVLTLAQLRSEDLDLATEDQLYYRCKAGRAVPMVELRVVDSDMNDVPADGQTTGEAVVRSPWLTQGYLHDPARSDELWRGGYLHTGDLGYLDESGYLRVTDRVKDVIKSGGEWISSLLLEDIATAHPQVSEAAAIGVADKKWGERPLVLIVARDAGLDVTTVRNTFSQAADEGLISRWAVPERIEIVDVIPKTSVGKIDKKLLRQQYSA